MENGGSLARIYVISDIHLEMRSLEMSREINIFPYDAHEIPRYLAMCGDIGNPCSPNYLEFLERHSKLFDHILIVAGNHEYYSKAEQRSISEIDHVLFQIASSLPNVTYLQETKVTLGNITFAGCTLWTAVDSSCERKMNDYQHIFMDDEAASETRILYPAMNTSQSNMFGSSLMAPMNKPVFLNPYKRPLRWLDVLETHQRHCEWLQDVIDTCENKLVVLTHHAPSRKMLRPEFRNEGNSAYASECDHLFKSPLVCWMSGHTHYSSTVHINDIPCVSNCHGYPHETYENTKAKCGYFVEIE